MIDVSVVIPVYNAATTIEKCVTSLLCQEGYFSYEIILVDDGSVDGSADLIDEMALKNKNIRVFHQVNAGPSAARNRGIDNARGRYLLFVDSDDYVNADYIRHLYEARDENRAKLVIGGFIKCYTDTEEKVFFESRSVCLKDQLTFLDDCQLYYYGFPFSKLYDMNIIRKHSIRFDENVRYSEDLIFCIDYLQWVDTVELVNCADYYYQCGNSVSLIHTHHSFDTEYASYRGLYRVLTAYANKNDINSLQIPHMHNWVKLFILRIIKSPHRQGLNFVKSKKYRLLLLDQLYNDAQLRSYMERDFAPNFLDKWITTLFTRRHLRLLDLFLNLFFRLRGLRMIDMYLKSIKK